MDLIFWLDSSPVCCKGIFDEAAKQWSEGKSYYICMSDLSECRAQVVSSEDKKTVAININLKEVGESAVDLFLKEHLYDVHIFNGYKSLTSMYLDQLLTMNSEAVTIVWCERPSPKGKKQLLGPLYTLYHSVYARRYRKKISALLPLGQKGIKSYLQCGWPPEKMFPFLYLPVMNENLPCVANKKHYDDIIRFVYLGRFSSGWKGTDILMKACSLLKYQNYTLDMVGGYGDYKEETLSWIEKSPNVTFGGTWPIEEACSRLNQYDVCIVPSRDEGWNVTVNEALMAGIGCITTDGAVSDEMIDASGAGAVVPARNAAELALAMDTVMGDMDIVEAWKLAAYSYRPKMTSEICAGYFIEIVNYIIHKQEERPTPPWIVR
ncbi:MAG: hypothetical protein PWQ08_1159 [Clostridiales bacterium]|nr:hypothetical protein [Clostridiales bacterium]